MRNAIISYKQSGFIERNIDFQNLPEHQTRVSKVPKANKQKKAKEAKILRLLMEPESNYTCLNIT